MKKPNAQAVGNQEDLAQINYALRGPVTDIFRRLIPDLRDATRPEAWERMMNNPELASRCFQEFRRRPDLFEEVLRGPNRQPVTTDDQPLSCGRTLAQIIAMIVRAIAKRYFQAKLDRPRVQVAPRTTERPGFLESLLRLLRRKPAPSKKTISSRATVLFEAFRDFLLYEWQTILIPSYAHMPVALVRSLGPRILDFHAPAEIDKLVENTRFPQPRVGPPLPPERQNDSEDVAPSPDRRKTEQSSADLTVLLQRLRPGVVQRLMKDLGLGQRQVMVLYAQMQKLSPTPEIEHFVQCGAKSDDMDRFIVAAKRAGLGPSTDLAACAAYARAYFTTQSEG
jgi:hypothetical protein